MILFIMLIIVIFISSINAGRKLSAELKKKEESTTPDASVVIEEIPKFCPPHKWFHQEVKDTEGKTVKWRLVCSLCGPLKPQTGPARAE